MMLMVANLSQLAAALKRGADRHSVPMAGLPRISPMCRMNAGRGYLGSEDSEGDLAASLDRPEQHTAPSSTTPRDR